MLIPKEVNAEIGVYHLSRNPELYTAQQTNHFEFVVTDIDGLLKVGADGTENAARYTNAQEALRLSVSSAAVPHFTQEVLTLSRGNNTMKFAGKATFGGGSFTFDDFIGADTKGILMAWQNLSYDVKTQKVGSLDNPATNYKKDCYLIEYTSDFRQVRKYIMHGVWINELSESNKDHEQNSLSKVNVTFAYDYAELDTSELV